MISNDFVLFPIAPASCPQVPASARKCPQLARNLPARPNPKICNAPNFNMCCSFLVHFSITCCLCAAVYQYLCASRKWLVGMYHLDVTAMFWFFGWCFAVIATHL